jgi:hypothetical protein
VAFEYGRRGVWVSWETIRKRRSRSVFRWLTGYRLNRGCIDGGVHWGVVTGRLADPVGVRPQASGAGLKLKQLHPQFIEKLGDVVDLRLGAVIGWKPTSPLDQRMKLGPETVRLDQDRWHDSRQVAPNP